MITLRMRKSVMGRQLGRQRQSRPPSLHLRAAGNPRTRWLFLFCSSTPA